MDFRWFNSRFFEFKAFLSTCIAESVNYLEFIGYRSESSNPVHVYCIASNPYTPKKLEPSNLPVTLAEIGNLFPRVLSKWFELAKNLGPATSILSQMFGMSGFAETRFLTLMIVLEIYINEQSVEGNTLKCKLDSLLKSLPESAAKLVVENMSEFTQIVVDTRNYHTHYDEGSKKHIVTDGADINSLIYRVQTLFVLTLLNDIGVDMEMVTTKMVESQKFQQIMSKEL